MHIRLLPIKRSLWLSVTICLLVACGHATSEDTDSTANDFLTHAPKSWTDYGRFLDRLQGTHELRITADDVTTMHHIDTIRQNDSCKLCLEQFDAFSATPKLATRGDVFAFNSNYAFSLRRATEKSPWVVTGVAKRADAQAFETLTESAERGTGSIHQVLRVWNRDLSELLQQTTFQVNRASRDTSSGHEWVTVDFQTAEPTKRVADTTFPIQSGTLTFDPSHSWCMRGATLHIRVPQHEDDVRVEVTYRDADASKPPIPERYVQKTEARYTGKSRPVHYLLVREFRLDEPSSFPSDSEFTLSAFGLPEPYGAPPVHFGMPWFLWVAVAGLGCLVVGIGFRYLKKRQAMS